MINSRLTSSIIRPNNILRATAGTTRKPDVVTRFMKNKWVGKICETASDNPVICQSIFSLGICCAARPATNYLTTPDKKDAGYASAHSFSSGVVGLVWPLLTATPLAAGVGLVLKKPQKFLKPEIIKKFYPNVGLKEVTENGKKIMKVMTNAKGEMLRQDGSVLCRSLEPLKIKHGDAAKELKDVMEKLTKTKKASKIEELNAKKAELEVRFEKFKKNKEVFETTNPHLSVDENGIVRSKEVFKTEDGKFALDEAGNKIGCAVQKPEDAKELDAILKGKKKANVRPITEEMETGIQKEQNIKSIINWIPDILLAPPRALLTIKLIPWLLKNVFGLEKRKKGPKPCEQQPQNNIQNQTKKVKSPTFVNIQKTVGVKKGGV